MMKLKKNEKMHKATNQIKTRKKSRKMKQGTKNEEYF